MHGVTRSKTILTTLSTISWLEGNRISTSRRLSPRSFTSKKPTSRGRSTTIDPNQYTASVLVAQIADGRLIHTPNTGHTPATTITPAPIIRSLSEFLSDHPDQHLTPESSTSQLQRRLLTCEK